jgi:hypothetical protein
MSDDEPVCNITARCEPISPGAGVSGCKHCGAELHCVDGEWVHWSNKRSLYNSVAIQRLADEVRAGEGAPTGYNRVYHRHNR